MKRSARPIPYRGPFPGYKLRLYEGGRIVGELDLPAKPEELTDLQSLLRAWDLAKRWESGTPISALAVSE